MNDISVNTGQLVLCKISQYMCIESFCIDKTLFKDFEYIVSDYKHAVCIGDIAIFRKMVVTIARFDVFDKLFMFLVFLIVFLFLVLQ